MAEFITIDDYDATVHREILDALVREDENVIEICEDRAIDEMRCYMSQVYDCNKIFAARGEERSQIVLMFALDIAVYHIFASTTRTICLKYASTDTSGLSSG